MASVGLSQAFLAAVQASLSVLLVMFYGGLAAHLKLIDRTHTQSISKICVRIFLPALLITKVGAELEAEHAWRYLVIVIWGIVCHVLSFLVGLAGHRCLGLPGWVTPSVLINNTTSYPLLLITALEETGILESLIVSNETAKDAMERAKSYFLIFSTISNCITFAVGPRLIDSEHVAEEEEGDDNVGGAANEDAHAGTSASDVEANEETRLVDSHRRPNPFASPHPYRRSSFLLSRPTRDQKQEQKPDHRRPWWIPRQRWHRFSPRVKWWLLFILDFFNAPLLGALIGAVIGLTPAFHRAFFNSSDEGGIFTAWLTSSLKSIGGLFVSLPVVVTGITLFCFTKEAKDNNESAIRLPYGAVAYVLCVRFIVWPAVSISVIYMLATKTALLGPDPILWFCLAMMPTGPSAQKLMALVQVAEGSKESEKQISKLLTISYLIAPILSLTVAGNLLACQAAIPS
ncbi:auxin efflux carrier [Chaetomidium leptoderma]|uniref:Auxin efflux carrier n=1 Tax=Chaetomidium leptoderma TaxID=669021 RepID=A0AAN6VBW6_9PEZI|nr:auxin efflux carrier [Chaetomidium leptoderma]